MDFKTVKFTQELSIGGLSCWPSLEMDMQPGEDPQEAFSKIISEIQKLNTILTGDIPATKAKAILEVDPEFEAFKTTLSMFKYREEALEHLSGSGYSQLNVEIKTILSSLPVRG